MIEREGEKASERERDRASLMYLDLDEILKFSERGSGREKKREF